MKRILYSILVLLVFALLLAGCAKSQQNQSTTSTSAGKQPTKAFKVGYFAAPIQNPTIDAIALNIKAVTESAGGKVVPEVFDFTPEGCINATEKLIADGVNGIVVSPMADSILPKIAQMCQTAGVYWVISMRSIDNPKVRTIVEKSPYFVGYVNESEEQLGYTLTKDLAQQGVKVLAFIAPAKGDTTGDARQKGMERAAKEFGMKVVAEARAFTQASQATTAVQSFIASHPDLQGIVNLGTTAAGSDTAAAKAISDSGKKIVYATVNTEKGLNQYVSQGIVKDISGPVLPLDAAISTALLVNSIMGTPIDKGRKITVRIPDISFTSLTELQQYSKYVEGSYPLFTADEARSMLLKQYNAKLTLENFLNVAKDFSIKSIVQRHKNLMQ